MKKSIIFLVSTFIIITAFSGLVCAQDFYLKQKTMVSAVMGQPPRESINEIWVSKNSLKSLDKSQNTELLMKLDDKKVYMINHMNKSYTEFPMQQFSDIAKMGMGTAMGKSGTDAPSVTVNKTGKTQKIGQYDCYEVKISVTAPQKIDMDMWVTDAIKLKMNDYRRFSDSMGFQGWMENVYDKMKDIEGFPIKQTILMDLFGMTIETTTETLDIQTKDIPASTFAVPADYTKQEMPSNSSKAGAK